MDPYVKGRLFVTEGKWHQLDGAKWHGVTPVKGYRLSFVYFNGENWDRLSEHDWQHLEALGFPCNNLKEKSCR
eukprot:4256160-Prorocentrum_lima.AAC.1